MFRQDLTEDISKVGSLLAPTCNKFELLKRNRPPLYTTTPPKNPNNPSLHKRK